MPDRLLVLESMRFYKFGPFVLDTVNRSLLRATNPLPLRPKAYDVLLMLIQNAGRTVRREELMDAIWGLNVSEGALNYQINQARRTLGDDPANPHYIKTFPKVGFRFIAAVSVISELKDVDKLNVVKQLRGGNVEMHLEPPKLITEFGKLLRCLIGTSFSLAGHTSFVLSASAIYAAYFGVALLVEISYRFDVYGSAAVWRALLIGLFVFLCSVLSLSVGSRRTASAAPGGLLVSGSLNVVSAALVLIGASAFLPSEPVTQANFQTYTAEAAYLKDCCYIVPLGLIFFTMPFHFVVAMERELQSKNPILAVNLLAGVKPGAAPAGTVFLRILFLVVLLIGMMAYSLIGRAHLFDNLKPGEYMSLFQNLIHVRMILYFSLAILCLAWYHRALNALRRECFEAQI